MSATLLVTLTAVNAASLGVASLLLWLTCKLLSVRRASRDGRLEAAVGYFQALLAALLALLGSSAAAALWWVLSPAEWFPLTLLAVLASAFLLSLAAIRLCLPVGWKKALAVEGVWGLLCLPLAILVPGLLFPFSFSAFVVPTGAMASAVQGYHKEVTCPECGHTFAVNASAEAEPGGGPPLIIDGCTCPNCRLAIKLLPPNVPPPASGCIPDPGVKGGDRILAGQTLLGARNVPPERFDPVVFDWPGPRGGPQPAVAVRYVMRLVGMPGELLAIHRGDIFVMPAESGPPLPADAIDLPVIDSERSRELISQGKLRILRKPPAKVFSLMHLVYDTRHPARDLTKQEERRWVEEKGWSRQGTGFVHDGSGGPSWLRYRHALRGRNGPQVITDFTAYNSWDVAGGSHLPPGENWASDLILECEADPGSTGELTLEVSRGPDRFTARFDLDARICTLLRQTKGKEAEVIAEEKVKLPASKARVWFANVDERLFVWVNGRLPFGDGVEYDGPKGLAPVKENDLDRPASVGVKGAAVSVKRLRLFRDTYYTTARGGSPAAADVPEFHPADAATWKHWGDAPVSVYGIGAGQYFVLGDNSQESSDSRTWGQVAKERLLGKVFWQYFPLSRFGRVE